MGAPLTESRPDGRHKRRVIERLVEVGFESRRSRPLMVGLADQAADRDDGHMRIPLKTPRFPQKLEAIHVGHPQVAEHEIGAARAHVQGAEATLLAVCTK